MMPITKTLVPARCKPALVRHPEPFGELPRRGQAAAAQVLDDFEQAVGAAHILSIVELETKH